MCPFYYCADEAAGQAFFPVRLLGPPSPPGAVLPFPATGDRKQKEGDGHPGHRGLRGVGGHLC